MSSNNPTAWQGLIDEWVARERRMQPAACIREDTVRVRDAIEIDDQAFVLISYDVEHPWPSEEDTPGEGRDQNTAVIQAARVRQPWIERDAARAFSRLYSPDGLVTAHEHPLGTRRAVSGWTGLDVDSLTIVFQDGTHDEVRVIEGWFLAIGPDARRVESVTARAGDGEYRAQLVPDIAASASLLGTIPAARRGLRSMYFSPRDLRGVVPVQRWARSEGVVVVAVALEQYDEGGILRLRIDGVRSDDDALVTWPTVELQLDGGPVASGICGEDLLADTLTVDIGFRPWPESSTAELTAVISGLRAAEGVVEPISLSIPAPGGRVDSARDSAS